MAITVEMRTEVSQLYVALFGRAPDGEGLGFWVGALAQGKSMADVANDMYATEPARAYYPTFMTNAEIVRSFYVNVLGREPDEEGQDFWTAAMNEPGATPGSVIASMINVVANYDGTHPDGIVSANLFNNRVEVAQAYGEANGSIAGATAILSTVTDDDATVDAAIAQIQQGSVGGQTIALTVNQDTLTGSAQNDTFNAEVANVVGTLTDTLQDVDSINGGDGTDTLNVTLNAGKTVTPTLNSVENVTLRVTKADGALDLSGATGVTNVTVANSTAATGTIAAVGAAALAVRNQNAQVKFDGSTATTLDLTLDNVGKGGTGGTHQVVDLAAVTAAAATTLNITANNANSDITATQAGKVTTVNIAATGANELKLADAADDATTIAVTGTGSVDFVTNGQALTAVKTLTVGDGGVTIDTTGGALENATTGAGKDTLTAVGANIKSISTGAGNDSVSIVTSALGAKASVDLGAGDDTLTLSVAPTAGATLSGGAGTDTLSVTEAIYTSIAGFGASDLAKITGFEVLGISDVIADGKTIDLSKVAGLSSFQTVGVVGGKSATVSNVGADASVIMKGDLATNNGALVVSLKDATGSSDTLNLTLNAEYVENNDAKVDDTPVTFTVQANGVETLNVVSTGHPDNKFLGAAGNKADVVKNTLSLTDDALVTLNVSGDQALVFASGAGQTKLATIDASSNTAGVEINVSKAANDAASITVTGSATAGNNLTGSANADVLNGGAARDTITGGKGGDTLTGGGGNDNFVFGKGDSSIGKGNFDTITDFVANTFGQGAEGKATSAGAIADATKLTGDTIQIAKAGTGANGIVVDVFTNAADSLTFLQNEKDADTVVAALDSSTGNLYIDNTGDGVADFFIQLTGVTTLDEAAFVLVA